MSSPGCYATLAASLYLPISAIISQPTLTREQTPKPQNQLSRRAVGSPLLLPALPKLGSHSQLQWVSKLQYKDNRVLRTRPTLHRLHGYIHTYIHAYIHAQRQTHIIYIYIYTHTYLHSFIELQPDSSIIPGTYDHISSTAAHCSLCLFLSLFVHIQQEAVRATGHGCRPTDMARNSWIWQFRGIWELEYLEAVALYKAPQSCIQLCGVILPKTRVQLFSGARKPQLLRSSPRTYISTRGWHASGCSPSGQAHELMEVHSDPQPSCRGVEH